MPTLISALGSFAAGIIPIIGFFYYSTFGSKGHKLLKARLALKRNDDEINPKKTQQMKELKQFNRENIDIKDMLQK